MAKPKRQRKNFKECGHRGFGKFCHYCKQIAELMKTGMTKEQAIVEIKSRSKGDTK